MADNVTCRECGADVAIQDMAESGGRCPKCGFNEQFARDMDRLDAVRKKEAEKNKKEDAKPPVKKRLW